MKKKLGVERKHIDSEGNEIKVLHYHTYLRWLVIQNKVVTYEYFMDSMDAYELYTLIKEMHYSRKDDWEMTRKIVYATISPWLKDKNKTEKDILPLITDERIIEYFKSDKPTDDDIEKMQEMIEATRQQLMGQS